MFWMSGSANYLWASLPVLLMIYVYRREAVYQGEVFTSVIWSVPFFVLGIEAGWAMDKELFKYYISEFGALPLPPANNPYRFMISDTMTEKIREVYCYEWTDEEI